MKETSTVCAECNPNACGNNTVSAPKVQETTLTKGQRDCKSEIIRKSTDRLRPQ